ncbi:MAG: sulfatase [bacterium]|nr:sulfatase [bacterium]
MRHRLLTLLCLFLLSAGISHASCICGERPNFVFILVDDLGKMDLGCEGSTFYETPHIDALAASSLRFENGYSACQVCSPSRAAIQTGKTPARVGITDYINPAGRNQPEQWSRNTRLLPASFQKQLDLKEVTVAEALKDLGYHTFFAGKWHLGGPGFWPDDQGYDINIAGHEAGSPPGGFFAPYNNPVLEGPPGEHLPIRLGRETADYIRSRAKASQPFFAMLSYYSVHAPLQTTQALWNKYQAKADDLDLTGQRTRFVFDRTKAVRQVQDNPLYAGMMEALDVSVGLVMKALQESGQAENTVIIFTSDNGGVSSGDGFATSALPMRGGKGRQWEGGIRQPFYIHVPGASTQGQSTQVLASGVDFFPTMMDLAGDTRDWSYLDGRSLAPVLKGHSLPSRALFWHYPHYGNQGGEPSAMMREGDWKLIHYFEDGRNELYELARDPGEQQDLASTQPQRVQSMEQALQQWLANVGATFPAPNPNFNPSAFAQELQAARQTGLQSLENQHESFLRPEFVPQGGWWQDRKQ